MSKKLLVCAAACLALAAAGLLTQAVPEMIQEVEAGQYRLFVPLFSGGEAKVELATTFAVIGDYGTADANEAAVARLVRSWRPAFVVTTGDDYLGVAGGTGDQKYDLSTGKDYCTFLAGITTSGSNCPAPGPSSANRFFPALGNHDYSDAGTTGSLPDTYTDYFDLPGRGIPTSGSSHNERYYDFVQGLVHFFILNSNDGPGQEPDGITVDSAQAAWLKAGLALAHEPWKIVIFHHPPFSSGEHGSSEWMQWPFAAWGADAVISGHDHLYERVQRDGLVYFVDGAGGRGSYKCGSPRVAGSQICVQDRFGAQRVMVSASMLKFQFIAVDGSIVDGYQIIRPAAPPR